MIKSNILSTGIRPTLPCYAEMQPVVTGIKNTGLSKFKLCKCHVFPCCITYEMLCFAKNTFFMSRTNFWKTYKLLLNSESE